MRVTFPFHADGLARMRPFLPRSAYHRLQSVFVKLLKYLYKYPQAKFPYQQLVEESQRRSIDQPEFELLDTGVFDDDR